MNPNAVAAVATKANLHAFLRYLGRSPRTAFWESPPLARWHTPMGHPWFDGVLSTGPAPSAAPELIQGSVDYFRQQRVSVFSWWLDANAPADGWDAHLRAAGFGLDTSPGMAIDLDAVDVAAPLPAGLETRAVETEADLRRFIRVNVEGFGMPATAETDFYELIGGLGLGLPIRHYVGLLEGEPVAASSLFLAAGVAGVQFVATHPKARGRGLGTAMTRLPLRDGLALGCRTGILQSSEMGYRVYERMGFRRVCEVENYFLKLSAQA